MSELPPTDRTRVRRLPARGHYDRETIYRILDEGLICHVGFVIEGQPYVIPTSYGRDADKLFIHGSAASRMLKQLQTGLEACVTVTLLDGLVLARSLFHHSMNYRSVVALGVTRLVNEPDEKLHALRTIVEHLVPGRWNDSRGPNDHELQATSVLELQLDEASAKIRTGPPLDDEEDYELQVWAGVVPITLQPGTPVADPRLITGVDVPEYALNYRRR